MPSFSPVDPVLVANVWSNIDEGWQVVKVLEIIIVPYCYLIMGRNKVAEWLLLATFFAVLHNIISLIASYIDVIYPTYDTTAIWLAQALCAAIIRIIEMVVNYMIVSALITNTNKTFFKIVTGIACVLVLFGRVFDVLGVNFLQAASVTWGLSGSFYGISNIRWGMAVVSLGGLIQSMVGLSIFYKSYRGKMKKNTTFSKLVTKSTFRMTFIQIIDFILIADFLYLKTNLYFLWLHQVADNLDNSRTLLLMLDVLFSKFMLKKPPTCAGKTTIIECLKYLTTGEQPSNTKNGAFIFDPKLANENEIRAQVKLKFRNVNQNELVVTRSLSVSLTASQYKYKTLESLLLIRDPKTLVQHSISSKCAEIDHDMPLHLGVSKPILENVIFCHQEDSFWPLSDPATLKKKFDEIFAATRYTKALENIKQIRKKKNEELNVEKNQLKNDKINKQRAMNLRLEKEELEKQITVHKARINLLDQTLIQQKENEMSTLMKMKQSLIQKENKLNQLNLQLELLENQKNQLSNIQIMEQSDTQLEQLLNRHLEFVNPSQDLMLKKQQLTKNITDLADKKSNELTRRGQFLAEQEQYNQLLKDRSTLIKELEQKKINPKELKDITNEKQNELANFKSEMKTRENELFQKLSEANTSQSQFTEFKRITLNLISQLEQKNNQLNSQINSTTFDSIEDLERQIIDLQQTPNFEINNTWQSELQEKERICEQLQDEMSVYNLQGDTRARLSLKQTEQNRKQETFNRLVTAVKTELPIEFKIETVSDQVLNLKIQKQTQYNDTKERFTKTNQQISAIDSRLSLIRTLHSQKTTELSMKLDKIKSVCGNDDYKTAKSQAELKHNEAKSTLTSMKSATSMYEKFIKKYDDTKCCPLCVRKFDSDNAGSQFKQKLEGILQKVPGATKNAEIQVETWQSTLDRLNDLSSLFDDCDRLSNTEIPALRQQRDQLEKERSNLATTTDDDIAELAVLELEIEQMNGIYNRVTEIVKLHRELEQLQKDISSLMSDLQLSGSTKTMSEVQAEYEGVLNECKLLRQKIDRQNTQIRIKQHEQNQRESRIRDLKDEIKQKEYEKLEVEKMKKQAQENIQEIQKLHLQINEKQQQVADVSQKVSEIENQIKDLQSQVTRQEQVFNSKLQGYQNSLNQMTTLEQQIQRYELEKLDQLDACLARISQLQSNIAQLESEVALVNQELDSMSKLQSEKLVEKRMIEDNLQKRKVERELKAVHDSINDLKTEIQQIDSQEISQKYQQLKIECDELNSERSELYGTIKQLESQVNRITNTINNEYKDIEKIYMELLYKVSSTELETSDLEKYALGLEQAIMKFHHTKMQEINKIIRELWMKTYRGSDIDTIEIKANSDAQTKRSYNYRVVMVRGDVEMDMRGRCSAGQKVLACIIIRLALAETFCLHCGILTLDEPTTNLDKENISSLAKSLCGIIESRQNQRNFQLIVITHDEEFMQLIGKSEYTDYYYRIEKNPE
ncbi:DNA repair protein rad50 [Boothiomyces sp. JEL0866]|nr:DNA repair protein rad50 [Boothiomyces sp. JEL0866]